MSTTEVPCARCQCTVTVSIERDRSLTVYCSECRLEVYRTEMGHEPTMTRARRIAKRFAARIWGGDK